MAWSGRVRLLPAVLAALIACAHRAPPSIHPLVGVSSPDWLLEPPRGVSPRGERVLARATDDDPYGIVLASVQGRQVVILDRREELATGVRFVVEAVLALPAGLSAHEVAWDCAVDGQLDPSLVGTITDGSTCASRDVPATAAWRVHGADARFEPIPDDRVTCTPIACESEDHGLVEGGVMGSMIAPEPAEDP